MRWADIMKLVTAFLGLSSKSIDNERKLWPTGCEYPTPATYSRVRQRKMAIIYFSTAVLLIK